MNKPYLIMFNNILWARSVTRLGALKLIKKLEDTKGIKAVLAYDIGNEGGN